MALLFPNILRPCIRLLWNSNAIYQGRVIIGSLAAGRAAVEGVFGRALRLPQRLPLVQLVLRLGEDLSMKITQNSVRILATYLKMLSTARE